MQEILSLIGREQPLFGADLATWGAHLTDQIRASRFLVVGGAGSIGSAVVKRLFAANPRVLHLVDLSENNLVEVVRDLRSSLGYTSGDFATFAIDCLSREFDALVDQASGYDYVLNFSALKHVRSEKDPFTLMRLIRTNIFAAVRCADAAIQLGARKLFCVSTDKASNPVNMMGASKRIMELFLQAKADAIRISSARFANVAFSDGSLLDGFRYRLAKRQPIAAPNDVRRYFVTGDEAASLCLFSILLGDSNDIFFPKLNAATDLLRFSEIASRFLQQQGWAVAECSSEDEARSRSAELLAEKKWPCLFFPSDTTGEKDFEEFYMQGEDVDLQRFQELGVVRPRHRPDLDQLQQFSDQIEDCLKRGQWSKTELVDSFRRLLPEFQHEEKLRNLDQKM